jgi:transcriptional regulator with XRE-family HTH domain
MPIHRINTVSDLGEAVWAVRKASKVRQDDVAGGAGVSHVFLRDLEHGKETVQIGLVLQVLSELGIGLTLDIPDDVAQFLQDEQAQIQRRRSKLQAERMAHDAAS